jgi:Putative methyltransferase
MSMPPEAALPSFADLQRPLPRSSPHAWRFAALRAASRAGALLSDGLRAGYRHGFDSGVFMAHVYANRAAGRTALGRAVDQHLLSRPTLQAFRDIRALAEAAVLEAIDEAGPDAIVADLAAGPAPYLVSALAARPRARAIIGDSDPGALDTARAEAARHGVADRVTLTHADAFDRAALAALDPRPDVVLELGLYGIYHDDRLIERHFADVAELAAPRQMVFNVQTRNPDIEYIARVWVNHEGERCVWRLRPLEQILGYAAAAGYAPATIAEDRHGIYRVVRLMREDSA